MAVLERTLLLNAVVCETYFKRLSTLFRPNRF